MIIEAQRLFIAANHGQGGSPIWRRFGLELDTVHRQAPVPRYVMDDLTIVKVEDVNLLGDLEALKPPENTQKSLYPRQLIAASGEVEVYFEPGLAIGGTAFHRQLLELGVEPVTKGEAFFASDGEVRIPDGERLGHARA